MVYRRRREHIHFGMARLQLRTTHIEDCGIIFGTTQQFEASQLPLPGCRYENRIDAYVPMRGRRRVVHKRKRHLVTVGYAYA